MDKKQRIIFTMLELVVKQGIYATPMSQVSKEANVAVGTIYHYFDNKQEILEEIYKMINQDYGVVLMANLPESDFKSQFEVICHNLFNYFIGNPLAFKFMEFVAVPPLIPKDLVEAVREYTAGLRDFYKKGIEEGHLRDDVKLSLLMQTASSCVTSAVKLKESGVIELSEKEINQVIEMAWDSIKKH